MGGSQAVSDPWAWLLGRTASGAWRHAPFRAADPGQGQDPSLEPRVEVVRRLIAYPPDAFARIIGAIARSDRDPAHPIQWVCHRSTGDAPARPYWLSFLRAKEQRGRRFYVAIELFDRERLGLWFLSGFQDANVPRAARAPFPEQPKVSLPRFELTDEQATSGPYERWIQLAFHDALVTFNMDDQVTALEAPDSLDADPLRVAMPLPSDGPLRGVVVDQSIVLDSAASAQLSKSAAPRPAGPRSAAVPAARAGHGVGSAPTLDPADEPPSIRSARARLVVCVPGRKPEIVPLARLTTVLGRDPRCDLVIDDRSVSGEHARIAYRDGTPTLDDLGSKNGTRVASQRVTKGMTPVALEPETYLAFGKVGCLFVRDAEETLLPGERRSPRHKARIEELVARGRLARDVADKSFDQAKARGVTPAEVLIEDGALSPETWAGVLPPQAGGGCVVLLFLVLVLLAGCHSFSIPPFYEQEIDEGVPMREGTREVTWEEDLGLHPIFQVRSAEKADKTEVHWLFPLGLYEREGKNRRIRFYPFYLRNVRTDPDGFEHDTTVAFPPGLFAGEDPKHGKFAYVFPFGGTMYGLFGKEQFLGVLFPLYGRTIDRGVEAHHVLFPLVSWSRGGDEKATEEGFRVLPFYGHRERTTSEGLKVYDRNTVLWPFINWVRDESNSRNPFTSVFIFPFYGRTRSDWKDDDVILWPFFRHFHDKQRGYEEWRFPFPFLIYGSADGTENAQPHSRFDFWPLFGFRDRGTFKRHFFAWPIERYERQETDEYVDTRFWLVPVVYLGHRESKRPEDPWTERKTRLWPLVRYERTRDGSVTIHGLAPIIFDDPNLNFETILDPLYRIFRWASRPDGTRELDLLLGLYSSRRKADGSSRWDVLGGLFGHGTDPQGAGKVRLLWFLDV